MHKTRLQILICGGTGCVSSGCLEVETALKESLEKHGIQDEVTILKVGCFGFCEQGPIVKVYPDNTFYVQVHGKDCEELVSEHLLKGKHVERLLFKNPRTGEICHHHMDMDFYKTQLRIALMHCGVVDPENIEDYIGVGGYEALAKCLHEYTPEQIIDIVKQSGLRGRGGAGFSTGTKWEFGLKNASDKKYIICNADEGDPGAFMDRSIMEGDPHAVIEAMAIAGRAVGADEGIVYIRAEYPLAVNRLRIAIAQAEKYGLLGDNIMGSGFNFRVRVNLGAGAFVCGEETALINSLQGQRGEPRLRPPFPAQKGLWGQPTVNNNVETYACVPLIITRGPEWFKQFGTEKSPGTKVFALAGKINNVGLIEVPMGTTLREVIFEIGGGIPKGKKFKAIQTGGPSGGCISEKNLDLGVDFETLTSKGSMMGSGGMIVMDEDDCMVNIAKFYLEFTVEESCGKCTPCRIGNTRMYEILERITKGKGKPEDLVELRSLGQTIKDASLCGLGNTAPNPVLSTLDNFMDEYEAHVLHGKCPAGACKDLFSFVVDPEKCIACTLCKRVCPVDCIIGERKVIHTIDQERCIKCSACEDKCPKDAIVRE